VIRSAVTISLVAEARGGPFVFWDDLAAGCRQAARLGFDAVEIFAPSPDFVDRSELRSLLDEHKLTLAAVGTGAGMLKHGINLTSPDAAQRTRAIEFIQGMIDFGGSCGAAAIIGSMQGKWGAGLSRAAALDLLRAGLNQLAEHAGRYGVPLLYEPLNRYETNLICTVADGLDLLRSLSTLNVKLLADLFHMNIEEADVAEAMRLGGSAIGHVHFVDSNRRPAGCGHTDFTPIAAALRDIRYNGYASAEALPYPDPIAAAEQTIKTFHRCFRE